MDHFNYRGDSLYAEDVPAATIAARYNTPCFVYSRATLERHYRVYERALADYPHRICFAVKANSSLGVLDVLARLGAGFEIVSGGELERVLAAGGDPRKVIFSGLGKTSAEIERALMLDIHCFNVESEPELKRIAGIAAALGRQAPVSIRVNPDVEADTHPHISTGSRASKFGIDSDRALSVYRQASTMPEITLTGIHCHIGSQLVSTAPFLVAVERLLAIVGKLSAAGIHLRHFNVGGGLGVTYGEERPPQPGDLIARVKQQLRGTELTLIVEPGRSIAANAGIFLTRVEYLKHHAGKHFAIVDGAMNDLLRPALYDAWQEIVPVEKRSGAPRVYDVVGPVCESADFLGRERKLTLEAGDLLAVRSAGAYGFVMSSNYNSRPRVAELMVDGSDTHLIRQRESTSGLFALESRLPG